MADAERIAEIRGDPREREVWLETGRRLLRGGLSETAPAWAHAEVARLEAAAIDRAKAPAGLLSSTH
jgi:hypothetical protein